MPRPLPQYHVNQVLLSALLSRTALKSYIEGRLNGN
jgi:hypothetical protein